jgi:hypothetical protein
MALHNMSAVAPAVPSGAPGLAAIVLRRSLQVEQGDNSDQVFPPIQHWQSGDLPALHLVSRFVDVLAFATANDWRRHHFPHPAGSRITPLGRRPYGKIPRG